MSIPRRYRDVLHKLREREVWLVDELPRECNAETLTYLDQNGLISWQFVSWSNQGHGKPPIAVRDGWNKPGITIDRTGDSWERQLAQRRTDGLHPTELKVSPHGQSVLTELAAAETDAQAAENEQRLQEESRQAGILAATIRARVRDNPALADAIRENYASMCARSNARAAQANLLVNDAVAHHHALREVIALTDPAGQTEGWRRLGNADRLAAALYCIGGVFDTGATEPLIPYPTDPRDATTKNTRALWNDWLRRLWIRDHDEYRRALRRGGIGAVHLEVVGSRSARGLEDVWEFVQREFAGYAKQPSSTTLAPLVAMTAIHVRVLRYLARQTVIKTQVVMRATDESGITNREMLGSILADLVEWGFVHTPRGERKGYQILPAGRSWLDTNAPSPTK